MDAAEGDVDVPHLHERALPSSSWVGCVSTVIATLLAPPLRRRFQVSKPTATIRTSPATTSWVGAFTPL